jgi:Protein of unknown function (DUF2490)
MVQSALSCGSAIWVFFILASLPLNSFGAEIQTQHAVDTSVRIGPFEPLWHVRLRTTPEGGGVSQWRTGPIFAIAIHERVEFLAGYYLSREKEDGGWSTGHRPFGGVDLVVWNRGMEIETRSLLERFFVSQSSDYTRFRNRVRISPPGTTAPYLGFEVFVDADGLRNTRYSFGLRRTFADELIVDFGYSFDNRRPGLSADRHMISTTIHWRNKSARIDPDL